MQQAHYDALRAEVVAHLGQQELYVQDLYAGADPAYRLSVRFVQELAWQNLFVRNLFIVPPAADLAGFQPQFTVLTAPSFKADPARHGSRSDVVIAVNLATREVIIAGTSYAGEIKKSIFTVLNYLLPQQGVLSMHCSANIGQGGDTALFFGLSGTGKTTLSADPDRRLIGDDEHGWSDRRRLQHRGRLLREDDQALGRRPSRRSASAIRFGTRAGERGRSIRRRGRSNFDDGSLTENTRGAYPIEFIPNAELAGVGGHPAEHHLPDGDAFGVLPPIARLSPDRRDVPLPVRVHGEGRRHRDGRDRTERHVQHLLRRAVPAAAIPTSTRSMLGERIAQYQSQVWLVNTGWTGGPYGVGKRMKIAYTRAMIRAALSGGLDQVSYQRHPVFNLDMPTSCPDVPSEVLDPRGTWNDKAAYDQQAAKLATMFVENFKTFEAHVAPGVKDAGPRV